MQRRTPQLFDVARWTLVTFFICALSRLQTVHAAGRLRAAQIPQNQFIAVPFSFDKVAANLQRLADSVPEEDYKDKLIKHTECACDEQDDPTAVDANANVADEAFQVAPSWGTHFDPSLPPVYSVRFFQQSEHRRSLRTIIQSSRQHTKSRSRCGCTSKQSAQTGENALIVAASNAGAPADASDTPTGLWLNTCIYSHSDLVFWRLTNSAYLPNGIVLKETIAYSDTCDLCKYNNLMCNKNDTQLMEGNCLCMWRVNGVDMKSMLIPCGSCVDNCIGVYKTFDVGKPEPAMQKGLCIRKKSHTMWSDVKALP